MQLITNWIPRLQPLWPAREIERSPDSSAQAEAHFPDWAPVCCKRAMNTLVRRARVRSNGDVHFTFVWGCTSCGVVIF